MRQQRQLTDFTGVVMYSKPYRDRDLLVKYLTKEFGKKMFLIRGAKRPKFKMKAAILPFTYGVFTGSVVSDGLSYLNSTKDIKHFKNISADIVKNAYATYIFSLIDLAYQDGNVIPVVYNQVQLGLELIDKGIDAEIISNIFEVQLLAAFGVAPNWRDCVVCHRTDLPFDYSEEYGGLLCQSHWHLDPYRLRLDARTIYYLRLFSEINLTKINDIKVQKPTKQKIRQTLDQIYEHSVGVIPKSKRFLDQLDDLQIE